MYRGKLMPRTGYDSNRLAGFCTYFIVNLFSTGEGGGARKSATVKLH